LDSKVPKGKTRKFCGKGVGLGVWGTHGTRERNATSKKNFRAWEHKASWRVSIRGRKYWHGEGTGQRGGNQLWGCLSKVYELAGVGGQNRQSDTKGSKVIERDRFLGAKKGARVMGSRGNRYTSKGGAKKTIGSRINQKNMVHTNNFPLNS